MRQMTKAAERLFERRIAMDYARVPKPVRMCFFEDGHLYTGQASQHNLRHARVWRQRLRIKHRMRTRHALPIGVYTGELR